MQTIDGLGQRKILQGTHGFLQIIAVKVRNDSQILPIMFDVFIPTGKKAHSHQCDPRGLLEMMCY